MKNQKTKMFKLPFNPLRFLALSLQGRHEAAKEIKIQKRVQVLRELEANELKIKENIKKEKELELSKIIITTTESDEPVNI